MRSSLRAAALLAVMTTSATTATAQDYPVKPIRIVGAASGGNSDVLSRFIETRAFSRKRIDDAVRW